MGFLSPPKIEATPEPSPEEAAAKARQDIKQQREAARRFTDQQSRLGFFQLSAAPGLQHRIGQ